MLYKLFSNWQNEGTVLGEKPRLAVADLQGLQLVLNYGATLHRNTLKLSILLCQSP